MNDKVISVVLISALIIFCLSGVGVYHERISNQALFKSGYCAAVCLPTQKPQVIERGCLCADDHVARVDWTKYVFATGKLK